MATKSGDCRVREAELLRIERANLLTRASNIDPRVNVTFM